MKHIYSTLAVAALTLGSAAQAVSFDVTKNVQTFEPHTKSANIQLSGLPSPRVTDIKRAESTQTGELKTIDDFNAELLWTFFDLTGESSNLSAMLLYSTVTDASTRALELDFGGLSEYLGIKKVNATVDLTNMTLSIPNMQYLGRDPQDGSELYFYMKEITEDGTSMTNKPEGYTECVGTIADNKVTFDPYDIICFGTPDNEILGWWLLSAVNTFEPYVEVEVDPDEGWTDYCEGTFVDGWMTPRAVNGTVTNPEDHPFTVRIQKYDAEPGRYRIYSPYDNDQYPFRDSFLPQPGGYIIFSIEDPEFVTVEPNVPCGVDNQGQYICNTNEEGLLYYDEEFLSAGYTRAMIRQALLEQYPDTVLSTYNEETKTVTFENCFFTVYGDLEHLYSWGAEFEPYMRGWLSFGTDAVKTVESDDAPVEYFNAQGLRVSEDTKGLVIRRQGNKTEKMIVR